MSARMRTLGRVGAVVSFVGCLGAGIWILSAVGFDHEDEALSTAIGLYFVGKAFFVGPMLALASREP